VSALWADVVAFLSAPGTYQGRFALQSLLVQHLYYTLVAALIAAAVAVPLGLWVGHRGRGELGVVAAANTGRAIPDFGIILIAFIAFGLSPIPVFIALVALAIPPILVNTYVGVRQVDADVVDAAVGSGYTGWQVLRRIELPLAAPLIMTGLRTAAVQVVATATLAAYVGLGGFGRLIIDGLAAGATRGDPPPGLARVVIGCVCVALLAVVTEVALGRLERGVTPRGMRPQRTDEPLEEAPDPERPALTSRSAA
jgi:osmoprotectant transport system permease protein